MNDALVETSPGSRQRWGVLAVAAVLIFVADQITKRLVRSKIAFGDAIDVLPGFDLVHTTNRGIAFGLFPDRQRAVAVVTAIILVGVAVLLMHGGRRGVPSMAAAGALAGGAIGNLVDRLTHDGVTDFIDIGGWPAFNIADIGIVLGAAILALSLTSPRSS